MLDEKTGATIAVSLKIMYFCAGANPRVFLNSPSYLSSLTSTVIDYLAYKKQKNFHYLDDIE